jgi:DNA-binding GntR family transcriptional regulator
MMGRSMPRRRHADSPPRQFAGVRPPTISEAVLQELREGLIRGRYAPGDPIRVDQVAAEFGISALPVREALRVLLAEGRVQYAAHRGYRVTALTVADVEEIFLMCGLLEAEAVRRGVPAMTGTGVKRMRSLLEKLESPPRSASIWDIVALHQDFHFVPIGFAGLPRVEAELRRLWDHTDHYRALYLFDDADDGLFAADHRAIADACAARDADRVGALMDAHRGHALARLAAHRDLRRDATPVPLPTRAVPRGR